jgi:hypothetical protein
MKDMRAVRFNERLRIMTGFLSNIALTSFGGGFGLWWSNGSGYWILAGGLAGIVSLLFSLQLLTYMKDEE